MLERVSLGNKYFNILVLLRGFIPGLVWTKVIRRLDHKFAEKLSKFPFTVSAEGVYLELGCLHNEIILKQEGWFILITS